MIGAPVAAVGTGPRRDQTLQLRPLSEASPDPANDLRQRSQRGAIGPAPGRLAPCESSSSAPAAASTRWPGRSPPTRTSPTCTRRRAIPGIAALRRLHPVDLADIGAVTGAGPGDSAPTWSWSARRRRWWPGWPTRSRDAGIACFGPGRAGGHDRGLEVVRQAGHGGGRHPDRRGRGPATTEARGGGGAGRVRPAVRGQGGRARRRARASWSPATWAAALAHAQACGHGGHRGVPRRPGGVAVRAGRRRHRGAAAARAGLQAGRGRRPAARTPAAWAPTRPLPWAPPGLAGEVLATVIQPAWTSCAGAAPRTGACCTRGWPDRGGRAGGRVQRPVRRPGDPGRARPAGHPAGRAAGRGGRRLPGRRRARCAGRRARRSPWSSPPRAIPGTRPRATRSTASPMPNGYPGPTCCTRARPADGAGRLVSAGGRVLNVVGTGPDLAAARAAALPGGGRDRGCAAAGTAHDIAASTRPRSPGR